MTEEYDYIIIGAGSAGCVLADRLSADAGNRTLLLEAGGRDNNYLFQLPMLMGRLMHSGIYNWKYYTEPEPRLNGRQIYWPRGKVLGGSSTLNGMLYVRGNAADYDRWFNLGLPGWSYKEVLPYFKRSEGHVDRAENAYHNTAGPLTVRRARGANELYDVFVEAGQQAGHPFNDDFNGAAQEGFGKYDFTIRNGKRCSAARAFLEPALSRGNLRVKTSVLVEKITTENNRATGAQFTHQGQRRRVRANKEVIVAGGVINSPQILMLSGIGDPAELEKHDIAVVHGLPGVGKNLHDHVDCCLVYQCKRPVTLYRDLRLDRVTAGVLRASLFGTGVISTFPYEAGAFFKTDPSLPKPDVQAHFMPALEATANMHFNLFETTDSAAKNHGFTIRVGPVNPASRGRIALRSTNPADPPLIFADYLSAGKDTEVLIKAVKMMREVIASKVFDPYRGEETAPGPGVTSDKDLAKWLIDAADSTLHPVGTCKMGNDKDAVVNAELQVHGMEGLRVVDASVMPVITSGNTNAPTIMIAEKAADMIRG